MRITETSQLDRASGFRRLDCRPIGLVSALAIIASMLQRSRRNSTAQLRR